MKKMSTGVLATNTVGNVSRIKKILNHIDNHGEKQAYLAKKEFKRSNIITLLIILFVMLPLYFYNLNSFGNDNPEYPNGAVKVKYGHISLYENTFWYTDSSQKYEFDFADYNIDKSYEPGEIILIYLDDNNNVVSVAHNSKDYGFVVRYIVIFITPIFLLFVHAFVGRKTYAKNWSLYGKWYEKEIEPYYYQDNFEEIIANKQYYDVTVKVNGLNEDKQRLYKKYRNRGILYLSLFVICIVLTGYFWIQFDSNEYSWLVKSIVCIYTIVFYILIDGCDTEMQRIKNGYYDNK